MLGNRQPVREGVGDMTKLHVDPDPERYILEVGVGSASLISVARNSPVDIVQPGSENWYDMCKKSIMGIASLQMLRLVVLSPYIRFHNPNVVL